MKALRMFMVAALAGGLVAGCKNARIVSGDTHEEPRPTLFTHEKHGGFDCVDCHTGIPKAQKLGEAKLPTVVKCEECHPDIGKPTDEPTRKAAAAASAVAQREVREHQITFNHEDHLKRIKTKEVNQACATCHKELPEVGQVRDVTPPMSTCTSCHYHEQEVAQARCTPCHVSLRRYPLKPVEAIAAMSHTGNWVREHRNIAKNGAETCAQCHDQTYCATCHANATVPFRPEIRFPERVETDFIHRGDYVSRHQIEASADPASCRKCHGSFFCDSCHKEQGVSPLTTMAGGVARNPHPIGWANDRSKGAEFHGTAARNNIVSCAGCHDQGPAAICVNCHRVPGIANVNIHPSSFLSKHKHDDIRHNGMCLACHTNG
jgi:hypothetical protein